VSRTTRSESFGGKPSPLSSQFGPESPDTFQADQPVQLAIRNADAEESRIFVKGGIKICVALPELSQPDPAREPNLRGPTALAFAPWRMTMNLNDVPLNLNFHHILVEGELDRSVWRNEVLFVGLWLANGVVRCARGSPLKSRFRYRLGSLRCYVLAGSVLLSFPQYPCSPRP
jgi:hypothetical protein